MPFDTSDLDVREKLALGCRILAMEGHGDVIWGHMSLRDPEDPTRFWMKANSVGLEEITPDDLVLIDFDGNKIAGMRQRHNEFPIHAEIMRRRPEVNVVVHTHPTLPTVLGSSGRTILPVTHEGCFFYPPAIPVFTEMTDLIVTREQGESVAAALGSHRALFMKNHGIAIAAETIEEAVVASMLLEKASRAQIAAISLGDVPASPDEEALAKRQHIYHPEAIVRAWHYLLRKTQKWDGMPR
ncbi:MAG TPA: class II aldolase/adducin family protein [Chloroflexota bacterium]|nr:class II aldolase/adducin family protein [Chloroflexota bacterium]